MRSVLNLSLPPKEAEKIKKKAKERGFSNTSAYIRFLLELDDELISAGELLAMARRADLEYESGKIKKYKSLAQIR